MSDNVKTVIITLETNVSREYVDDFLIPGIRCMKGVLKVDIDPENPNDYWALENARRELSDKIWEALHPKVTP